MTQPEPSQKSEETNHTPSGPPKTIGVYERPQEKRRPSNLMIALAVIILLSLLAFWLLPALF